MSWDDERNHDDVLLPMELEALHRSRPKPGSTVGENASWLLWKASLLDRVAAADRDIEPATAKAAVRARKAGLRLQRHLVSKFVPPRVRSRRLSVVPAQPLVSSFGGPA